MSVSAPDFWWSGAVALGATAAAVLLRWLLDPWLGDYLPLATLYAAVAASVWIGGYRSALSVVLFGYLLSQYLFIRDPALSFSQIAIGVVTYLISCAFIIVIGEAMRRAQDHAERTASQLMQEVAKRESAEAKVQQINGQLQSRLAELEALLDILPVGVWRADRNCERITGNRVAYEMLGLPIGVNASLTARDERLTGVKCFAEGKPLDPEALPMQRVARSGKPLKNFEHDVVFDDGRVKTIECNVAPLVDGDSGAVYGVVGVYADITERKRIERALRESEQRFQRFMDNAPINVYIKDSEGRYVWVNRRLERSLQRPLSEWIGKTDFQLFFAEQAASWREADTEAMTSRALVCRSEILFAADGVHQYLSYRFPIQESTGQWLVAGMSLDITEQKKAEAALRLLSETAAILLATDNPDAMLHALFARIAPQLGLAVYFNFMASEAGSLRLVSYTGVSEEAARAFARRQPGESVCGTVAQQRTPITVQHIQRCDDPLVQLVRSLGIRAYTCIPLLAGDALLGTLSFGSRSRDAFSEDELEFLQVICRYVAAAYERLRLIERLRDADRRKDRFLAILAHELRNPLAPMRNAVQILSTSSALPAPLQWVRGVLDRQVGHMARLLDDLLDVSRIAHNKLELRKAPMQLAEIVRTALETSRPLIEANHHQLHVELPEEPIWLDVDPVRLAQVFANLLNNASKYTEAGGHIALTAHTQGSEVVVCVKDDGIGIEPEALPHVFEMFAQAKSALERAQGGLGIGLSLAKALVELHGGAIEVQSRGLGQGSTFIVRLPTIEQAETAEAAHHSSALPPAGTQRILVVDDNRDNADSLAMMLQLMGHNVRTGYDGEMALELAATIQPQVILLDIGLPKLDGYEVCRRIRQQSWGKAIVIIALTGWGQQEDRARSLEAGFDHHLVKPVDVAELVEMLGALPTSVQQK
ncbi:MAG TPA: ATP-binding protein [Burkholderiales bacterium]|nr:ATP-binding protein [Burkholderiales bacterium]